MNLFSGMGRLTRDPELRTTQSGKAVVNFTIAINRRFKNESGEYEADFLPCVAWDKTADFINKFFAKGRMIGIAGTVSTRNYEDKDGIKRYVTEILVEQAHFAGEPKLSEGYVPADDSSVTPDAESLPFDM